MKKISLSLIALGGLAGFANAQLSSVGQFSGALNDNFESYANYNNNGGVGYDTLSIMGGAAKLTSSPVGSGQNWIYDVNTAGWSLGSNGPALATSGTQGLGLYFGGGTISTGITFTNAVYRWGTMFASVSDTHDDISFFDANGAQIGTTQSVSTASNQMVWIGWQSTVAIKSITFSGPDVAPVMDDFQADVVPEPASLAVLGLGVLALKRRRR